MKSWMDILSNMPRYFTNESAVSWDQWTYQFKQMICNENKMIKDFSIYQTNNMHLKHFSSKLAYMSYLTKQETYSSMKARQQLQLEEIELLEQYFIPFLKQYKESHISSLNGTIYLMFIEFIDHYLIWDYQKLIKNKLI